MDYVAKTYIGYDENNKEVYRLKAKDYNEIIDLVAIKNAVTAVYEEAVYQSRKVIVPKLVDANWTARKAISGVKMGSEIDDVIETIRTFPEREVQCIEDFYQICVDEKNIQQQSANTNARNTVQSYPSVVRVEEV